MPQSVVTDITVFCALVYCGAPVTVTATMPSASAFSATWNAICGNVNVTELLASCCTLSVAVPVVWFTSVVYSGDPASSRAVNWNDGTRAPTSIRPRTCSPFCKPDPGKKPGVQQEVVLPAHRSGQDTYRADVIDAIDRERHARREHVVFAGERRNGNA